jgi:6-phosphogluconolactonase (cycloisomerase 2 family)
MDCAKRHPTQWSSVPSVTCGHVSRVPLSRLLLILAIPILLGSLAQGCGGGGGGPAPSNIKSITIDPINPSLAHGTRVQLHATANFKNKKTKEITESATWVSADSAVAIVSNVPSTKGLAAGVGVGATSVTVKFQGKKGTSAFTVTNATLMAITVTPAAPAIAKGTTVQLSAIGDFSNGSTQDLTTQVTWSSGNSGIATVSTAPGTQGLVTGVSVGNTPITATLNGIAGSTTVRVSAATLSSITITPANPKIPKGIELQLFAICNFNDGTTEDCTNQAGFSSASNSIASVSTHGLVKGVGAGSTSITATLLGVSGSTTVTVTTATFTSITVVPGNPSIVEGTTVQLFAVGGFSDGSTQDVTTEVSWTSAEGSIAQVSDVSGRQGLVTGLAAGTANITAKLNGVEGSSTVTVTNATLTSITVDPANSSIAKGTTVQLAAIGHFSNGTTQVLTKSVSWISSSDAVAPVDAHGLVKGVAVGSVTVTATQGGISGTATVNVTPATLVSITVDPSSASIIAGGIKLLTATGTFSDGTIQDLTTSASWISSDPSILTVETTGEVDPGLVTGEKAGTVTVTATEAGISGTATVTVTTPPEFAYVINDTDNTVSVFSINLSTGVPTLVQSSVPNPGSGAATVTADPSGKFLYVANQAGGATNSVTAYSITQSGPDMGKLALIGPFSATASMFGIAADPSGHFVYAAFNNLVAGFAIDMAAPNAGALTAVPGSPFSTAPAFGPQGVAVHPNDKYIYVTISNNGGGPVALNNGVALFTFNPMNGALNIPGTFFLGGHNPGDSRDAVSVTVDPLGRFVYVANNESFTPGTGSTPFGSVSAFTVDFGTGDLTFVDNFAVGTSAGGPAQVAVDPRDKFAYVAGGGVATAFTINRTTGVLTPTVPPTFPAGLNTLSVAVDPSGKFVYVANHGSFGSGTTPGSVSAYAINSATGALTPIAGSPFATNPNGEVKGPSAITVVAVP